MVYSRAWGKLIHEKNQKQKISWHCPFKRAGRSKNMIAFYETCHPANKMTVNYPKNTTYQDHQTQSVPTSVIKIWLSVTFFLENYCQKRTTRHQTWQLSQKCIDHGQKNEENVPALQRHNTKNSKQLFPEKRIAWPKSQFPHLCVGERFIYSHNRSAYIAAEKYVIVGRSWEYINGSQTHQGGNCNWGRAVSLLEIHKWDFCCSVPMPKAC